MNIHYTYRYYIPIPIVYDIRDKNNVWVNMFMKGYLTPEILHDHLCYWLEEEPSEGLIEAILGYPDLMFEQKDVTVDFTAGS